MDSQGKPSYHKRRRRGARSMFVKKKQQAQKENIPPVRNSTTNLLGTASTTSSMHTSGVLSPPFPSNLIASFSSAPACTTSSPLSPTLSANLLCSFSSISPSVSPSTISADLPASFPVTPTSPPTSTSMPTGLMYSTQPQASLHCSYPSPSASTKPHLPDENWNTMVDSNETQYYRIEKAENGLCSVTVSVIIHCNNSWKVFVHNREVPATNSILSTFPDSILPSSDTAMQLVHAVHRAALCPGNPEEKFVSMCKSKGGKMKGERGHGDTVSFIDDTAVIDSEGRSYSCSVRRTDCEMICERKGIYPTRCKTCNSYRDTLRSSLSRQLKDSEHKTATSSHACYYHLTSSEKDSRLHNLHNSLKISGQHIAALKAKVAKLVESHSLRLHDKDASDITSVIKDVTPLVESNFPLHSPQRIFWDQQVLYNSLKDKRQMRWHPYMIRFALNLKYLSTSAYKAVRTSSVINLPSERTLADYTHWSSTHCGVQLEFIEEFSRLLSDVQCGQRHCVLAMDEMKIKSGLVFDKHHGILVGFTDLGSVNRDIELIMSEGNAEAPSGKQLADQVFVFLVRAVYKPSLSLPIAHYPTSNLKGDQIFPVAWDVIEALEMYNIPVVSLTSDGAKPNRRFYRMCQKKGRNIPYKCTNHYTNSNLELYFFCDVPHLLKTARNCFSNSFAHSKSRKMQKNGQEISWKWIEHLYLTENTTDTPGVRMCHKLSRDHVWLNSFTRMRVYLAAQVMSQSVACALETLNRVGTRETRIFIRMVDKFFDCLNVRSAQLAKLSRNDNVAPYGCSSDERFKWLRVDFLSYLSDWESEGKSLPGKAKEKKKFCLSRETIEGMKITVNSFTELVPKLLQLPGVSYLLSEVFSQDPLERYFSKQRHRGGSNDNPTAYQVPYSAATLVQQKSVYRDLRTMNVEPEPADQESAHSLVDAPLQKRRKDRSIVHH